MKLNHNPRVGYMIKDVADHYTVIHCHSRTKIRSKDLRSVLDMLMDVDGIGKWDEGSDEYLEPLALLCSFTPSEEEYDAITGVWYDVDGRYQGTSAYYGLVTYILAPKAIAPPRDSGPEIHKLPTKATPERYRILRLLDSINLRCCGQPQLTGIMEVN